MTTPVDAYSSRTERNLARHFALFLVVLSRSFLPISCVVYTNGDLAVTVNGEGDKNSSCAVHPARHGFLLSPFLKSKLASDVMEVNTATINKMAEKCPRVTTRISSREHSRTKRSIFNLFRGIYPGTKWCGVGDIADDSSDMGYYRRTDECCRQHDSCPFSIPGRKRRYGVYNESPFTVSSCSCDIKFKRCLQDVGSFVSRVIEFIFFNIGKLNCLTSFPRKKGLDDGGSQAVLVPLMRTSSHRNWFWNLFRSRDSRRRRRRRSVDGARGRGNGRKVVALHRRVEQLNRQGE